MLDGRFTLHEGKPASHHLSYTAFWRRYLDVFDSVIVVGRLYEQEDAIASPVEGPGVSFLPVPGYYGAFDYLRKRADIKEVLRSAYRSDRAFILRVPSMVGSIAWQFLHRVGHPYGLEVVGDPYDSYAPGSIKHPLRPILRRLFTEQLRRQCAGADAVAYVTESALQKRYPPASRTYSTHYSSIQLGAEAFVDSPRVVLDKPTPVRIVTVGMMDQLYKGPDILLEAVALCRDAGADVRLTFVGDGAYRGELEDRTRILMLNDRVEFVGRLPAGERVRYHLDQADLFVLPSRQEGLPRAMIEAMARALPCIGSSVGGIPELLTTDDLVPPSDSVALANKILTIINDPKRMTAMSARNLGRAREYRDDLLRKRRIEFYRAVRDAVRAWQQRTGG